MNRTGHGNRTVTGCGGSTGAASGKRSDRRECRHHCRCRSSQSKAGERKRGLCAASELLPGPLGQWAILPKGGGRQKIIGKRLDPLLGVDSRCSTLIGVGQPAKKTRNRWSTQNQNLGWASGHARLPEGRPAQSPNPRLTSGHPTGVQPPNPDAPPC